MLLQDIMDFSLGKNPTRVKEKAEDLYTPEDFEKDLHSINTVEEDRGCIINLIKSKCAPVSLQTAQKCITSNFLRCSFDTSKIYPWYFCYQFNEGKDFEQQIEMFHQGSTLSVKKLNVKTIGELKLSLPDYLRQKQIGDLYRQTILQYDLMLRQAENMRIYNMTIIRKMEGLNNG